MAGGRKGLIGGGFNLAGGAAVTLWPPAGYVLITIGVVVMGLGAIDWLNERRSNAGKRRLKLEPIHLIIAGLFGLAFCALIAVGGVIWQFNAQQKTTVLALETGQPHTQSEQAQPQPRRLTAYETEHKLRAIDHALEALGDSFDNVIYRPGANLSNGWESRISTHEKRQQYVQELTEWRQRINQLSAQLVQIRSAAPQYPDFAEILSYNYPPDTFNEAVDGAITAINGLGENPNINLNAVMGPYHQALANGIGVLMDWRGGIRVNLLKSRKEISG